MSKRPKKMDLNQLAKRIVDEAIGDEPIAILPEEKNKSAQEKKRIDGLKGGKVRAQKLTAEQRREIARLAASTRWHKVD